MAVEQGSELVKVVVLLAAGVLAVPLFKRLGLGSVLGYLAAGLAIGPFGLGLFSEAGTILHLAELGVVMFLFVIGLEMQPTRLWTLRRQIFGLGLAQVVVCGALLTALGMGAGLKPVVAFIAAMGFVLSSTAIVMQLLEERGDTSTPRGQRMVSILLLEDLAIVPLLAIVAFLAPAANDGAGVSRWVSIGVALAAIIGLVAVSRWLLNPLFRVLARAKAREVMTAAALLVVLGAALAMQWGGLSMALGAFAAGVMLSESTFRHQLEADIEPFRGILLGLFFMGVGMSLDLKLVLADWPLILGGVLAYMAFKGMGIYAVARVTKSNHGDALQRTAMMAQGGEFAFVLYSAAAAAGIVEASVNAVLTAAIIISMALTPLAVMSLRWLLPAKPEQDMDGVDVAQDLRGSVLIIGFGRFGQIASQSLLARGIDIAIIENDTDMIRAAAQFGFKVYYGDGTRLDVLHASGAGHARAILVCVDKKEATSLIVELAKHEFPLTPVLARAYDRQHAIELIRLGVDYQLRETLESALTFSSAALRQLGVQEAEVAEVAEDIRRRDAERLQLQLCGDISSGIDLMHGGRWTPAPLTRPKQSGQALNEQAAEALEPGGSRPPDQPEPGTDATRPG
ncbi:MULTISPECIES: monovalent cation:proton antiporter-2 (CPA2) family protein [unclassified Polaromonas]|jgi:glutathione-regulated potassium-efflux system protein KefB|uniref:monovalent cation:proton antiporter-2 (CPA2) family protein n=1 Tax=unclassified Polaromonas TaxID=2638319 RepID=UPI000BD5F7E2|nr:MULTISPECIES: monovalent cation:proton antiporter-2 (CPA2) family protein [unclassified Polaromonas]OYZ20373.1 MAG: potassium transporter [Polaromonas sp. 16-63-31]OYZ80578.1 MAG: potassium transporter [Polaromonas sp. 24-63-21]OZA51641.1 MAG: potassium transporter [Polaromonas sp. 17-63-33]OZA89889.1 MAG: potassium transporter [Polaromonas sp. 39-63-25]HQS00384.1 monovalent cation:proton antiporter-2 (CPA2) family protein [Polaromonas sp.]